MDLFKRWISIVWFVCYTVKISAQNSFNKYASGCRHVDSPLCRGSGKVLGQTKKEMHVISHVKKAQKNNTWCIASLVILTLAKHFQKIN